jgi:ferredoxin
MPIDWLTFARPKQVDIGPPFGRIELAADAVEADFIINLAKLKTHVMMRLTLGVKNMFGCVIGMKKTQWHLQTGVDRDLFARLLVQICHAVNPGVTLVDGILALEGQGPGKGGTTRHLGLLAAGRDPVALDYAVSRLVGCPPESLPTHQAAIGLGLFAGPPTLIGNYTPVAGFRLPELGSAGFGPEPVQRLMRKHLLRRPAVNKPLCRVCGVCGKQCPAGAIATLPDRICIDTNKCIRCYCCVEVCPHGALFTADPLAGRMARQLKEWALRVVHPPGSGKRTG